MRNFTVKKSEFKEWDSVLKKSSSISIETLKTGTIICKVSGLINLKNEGAKQIKGGYAKIPVLAHILRHEKYGDYLIDTGFDSTFSKKAEGNFKGILSKFYFKKRHFQEKDSEGVEKQLEKRSINLKGVFLTHIHEHAAGVPSLPKEIPYIYGYGEKEVGIFPLVYSDFFANKIDIQKIDILQGQDMPILGKCIDIFGDGSLWAISTPGHTKGHISYLINGQESKVLIMGDICSTKKGFEIGVETGKYSSNIKEGRKSFLKLKEFVDHYPYIEVVFGHETDEFKVEYR